VLLAVIGPRWLALLATRAGDPKDFVIIEIKAALDQGKLVIPVLVGGAAMPSAETLPEPIPGAGLSAGEPGSIRRCRPSATSPFRASYCAASAATRRWHDAPRSSPA